MCAAALGTKVASVQVEKLEANVATSKPKEVHDRRDLDRLQSTLQAHGSCLHDIIGFLENTEFLKIPQCDSRQPMKALPGSADKSVAPRRVAGVHPLN
jgi:hypothetical protein